MEDTYYPIGFDVGLGVGRFILREKTYAGTTRAADVSASGLVGLEADGIVVDLTETRTRGDRIEVVQGRQETLAFHRPSIGSAEIAEVVDTLRSGWLTTGPKTRLFTEEFCAAVEAPDALAVSSCTAALHLGLLAAGIGPGDVVYTTPITFAATVHVIRHTGARPVLVDVEPDTLNIDPDALAAAIEATDNGRPAAVMPVHFAGHPCEMDSIFRIAQDHKLAVVEDAAHSLPASYRGRPIGSVGQVDAPHLAAFSFYVTKNLGIGEGGMLTGSSELIESSKRLSLHGMSRDAWKRYQGGGWEYDVAGDGYKYNFTDIQAAIGLHQLRRLGELQERRLAIVEQYQSAFAGSDALETPIERSEVESAWHLYVLRLRLEALRIDRAEFIRQLDLRKIGTSVHFIPIHRLGHFANVLDVAPLPVADREFERYLSLPLYPGMSEQDVADVVAAVQDVVDTYRR